MAVHTYDDGGDDDGVDDDADAIDDGKEYDDGDSDEMVRMMMLMVRTSSRITAVIVTMLRMPMQMIIAT
eukprot:5037934-Pyramimonas_sp.AAC.1